MPACTSCSGNRFDTRMPCEVCKTVDNDSSVKWVYFCDLCGAFICKEHEGKWVARVAAAAIKLKNKIIQKP